MEMRKARKSWSAVILSFTALLFSCAILFTQVTGDNITASDPLISLSYLNDIFKGQLMHDVDQAIDEQIAGLENDIGQKINGIVNSIHSSGNVTIHARAYIPGGSQYLVLGGADFLVLSGTAKVNAAGLLDTTTGEMIESGTVLEENHLYMSTGAVTLTAETETCLLIRE